MGCITISAERPRMGEWILSAKAVHSVARKWDSLLLGSTILWIEEKTVIGGGKVWLLTAHRTWQHHGFKFSKEDTLNMVVGSILVFRELYSEKPSIGSYERIVKESCFYYETLAEVYLDLSEAWKRTLVSQCMRDLLSH